MRVCKRRHTHTLTDNQYNLTPPTHPCIPPQQLVELCKKLLKAGDFAFEEVMLLHDDAGGWVGE